jgi:Trypsin-co-occurring domain 1
MAGDATQPEFLIQVEQDAPGVRLERASDRVIDGSEEKLDAAAALAHQAAEKLGDVFTKGGPDSGSVEFGLTFEAETGVPILAKGKVGASITVTLNWGK